MNSALQNIAIGVDIGGSHITAVAVDMTAHRIISGSRAESPVDNKAEADEILTVWSDTLKQVLRGIQIFNLPGWDSPCPGPLTTSRVSALSGEFQSMRNCTESMLERPSAHGWAAM
jgi:glucokinase